MDTKDIKKQIYILLTNYYKVYENEESSIKISKVIYDLEKLNRSI